MGPFHIYFADSNQHAREHIKFCVELQSGELTHQKVLEMGIVASNKKVLEINDTGDR